MCSFEFLSFILFVFFTIVVVKIVVKPRIDL